MTHLKSEILPTFKKRKQVSSKEFPIMQQNDNLFISAKLLHEKLQSRTKFSMWIQRRIKRYGFEENQDFFPNLGKSKGGRRGKDFLLSIDMAKEISMLEETETGRKVRRYFIQKEKEARGVSQLPKQNEVLKGLSTKRVNDRVMYLMTEVRDRLGYKTRRVSGSEKDRYWMHFIKEGNRLYCTEEYAMHKYYSRMVYNNRKTLKASQPVLPLNFGDTSMLNTGGAL